MRTMDLHRLTIFTKSSGRVTVFVATLPELDYAERQRAFVHQVVSEWGGKLIEAKFIATVSVDDEAMIAHPSRRIS